MRLFLAIDLPSVSKKSLAIQIREIQDEYPQFNWVATENFHITIHFFGETKRSGWIKQRLEGALFDLRSFRMYSQGADLFLNKKIVLYIYFRREKTVEEIKSRVCQALQIKENKKFVPHLTIARAKIPSKQQYLHLKKKLHHLSLNLDFAINKIYLFKTIMTSKKPVYKKIANFPLLMPHQF